MLRHTLIPLIPFCPRTNPSHDKLAYPRCKAPSIPIFIVAGIDSAVKFKFRTRMSRSASVFKSWRLPPRRQNERCYTFPLRLERAGQAAKRANCRRSMVVMRQPSKLVRRVRFPSPRSSLRSEHCAERRLISRATARHASFRAERGEVPKWPNGADCKSAGLCLRWFESIPLHQFSCPATNSAVASYLEAYDIPFWENGC